MSVSVRLLGGFDVVVDGVPVPPDAWSRRQAASLVKVLALAPGHRLHREQVIEALWPGSSIESGGPRLHKVAHYARRALGGDLEAVLLRNDMVALLPEQDLTVDVEEVRRHGQHALHEGSSELAIAALEEDRGPLLPEDRYEPWAHDARESVALLHLDLLRLAERWEQVLDLDPADEPAHLALVRAHLDRGDVRAAQRQFERLTQALRRELGTAPSPEVERVRAQLDAASGRAGRAPSGVRLVGRRGIGNLIREGLARAESGRGGTLLISGPAGVGKSAVLDLAEAVAHQRDWRSGRGAASAVEGPWPYAPILEAFGDLGRRHPALLDGLDDNYRTEIERALSGRDVTWTGESSHQRLFVAVAEMMRLAATGHGLLLMFDDIHDADEASLRLLHYLSRAAVTEPVLIVVAHRPVGPGPAEEIAESLVRRGSGTRVELSRLDRAATRRLLADRFPDLAPEVVQQICEVSAGLPFTALELARGAAPGLAAVMPMLPADVAETFQRIALFGPTFSTDELLALSGLAEDETYRRLEVALSALVVEPTDTGYQFRHSLVREALVREMVPRAKLIARREVAERMAQLGGSPSRLAHLFVSAGLASRAVPYAIRAVETAGALGAYRDALSLIDAVRPHAGPAELPQLLARRGDLLQAIGDPEAVEAYQEAVGVTSGTTQRLVRARLARAAAFTGDLPVARAALDGLSVNGDPADPSILLAQGMVAFFEGDLERAWSVSSEASDLLASPDDPWHLVNAVLLQGLIAHQRGEWFERFHQELRRTRGKQQLATALFDAHLCVAEYVLYGPVPYEEVIRDAEDLLRRATQMGALRGIAFATALIGEAALLMGDLTRAERELVEAVDLHRDIDAPAGEAHSLQRLAEVRLAQGDRLGSQRLLERALPMARWSVIGSHLLQRIYGTMISAAPDTESARAVVDQAEATLGNDDECIYCAVMLAVPAAIACADVGDLDAARRHLLVAEVSAARWSGHAWSAAVVEAKAHIARAEGLGADSAALFHLAAEAFVLAGQPRDAERCRGAAVTSLPGTATAESVGEPNVRQEPTQPRG
ncbi:ATP-binding protein [Cellulomonas sp. McL0617]|uniref:ATP-binding protein n=1 Tax=Cellulomonas sp. McL0617 TaxID=3415675 RepID=UPI003CEA8C38